ncbi:MAG: hypothetical protein AVDCRST_MAG89-4957 [uncultured Gemmatimonadetes bacterium]|uniref:GYF domain-containing protein n=1 Tax=uncultured Gemmatimonadota bacterium TaxID=203437 RepID=A0A6J4N7P9_9BACT|nr:MAG: hypothetical protein AVDCRST_MAG89-4957 [uncultured Gemmatimonadota bacterium]
MALQPCRECGASVSTEAVFCPHCGVPQPTRAGLDSPVEAPGTPPPHAPAQPAAPEPGAADAQAWHYIEEGVRHGPVSQAALREMLHRGEIPPDTPVKSDGALHWLPISRVPGLGADLPPEGTRAAEHQGAPRPGGHPPQHGPTYAQASPEEERNQRSAQTLGHVVYALQAASFLTGVTLFVALVVNYAGRDSVRGTYVNTHFDWQIGTFCWLLLWWIGAAFLGLVAGSAFLFVLIYLPSVVWLLYRVVYGWIRLNEEEPV